MSNTSINEEINLTLKSILENLESQGEEAKEKSTKIISKLVTGAGKEIIKANSVAMGKIGQGLNKGFSKINFFESIAKTFEEKVGGLSEKVRRTFNTLKTDIKLCTILVTDVMKETKWFKMASSTIDSAKKAFERIGSEVGISGKGAFLKIATGVGKEGASALINISSKVGKVASTAFSGTIKAIGKVGSYGIKAGEQFAQGVSKIADFSQNAGKEIEDLNASAATMEDGLGREVTIFKSSLMSLGKDMGDSIDGPLKEITASATGMIGQLSSAFQEGGFEGLAGSVGDVFTQAITGIADKAPEFMNIAVLIIESLIAGFQENMPLIAESSIQIIMQLAEGIITILPSIFELGITLISELLLGLVEAIPQLITLAQESIISIMTLITENLPLIMESGFQIVLALINGIAAMLPELIPMAVQALLNIVNTIITNLPQVIDAAIKIIMALIQGIIGALPQLIMEIPKIINGIVLGVINNLPAIISAAIQIIMALVQGLIVAIPTLVGSIPTIIAAIIGAFAQADWKQIGINCLEGLKNGLLAGVSAVMDTVKNVASSIANGFKDFFGIHSPSTLFRDMIGKNLIKGIGVGIDVETPNLEKEVDGNLEDLTRKMRATIDFETTKVSGNMAMNSSYRAAMETPYSIVNNNDNGVNEIINIYQPVKSPSEVARAIKIQRKELAFG
ncbi:hypothetical protein [Clostridium sp. UBA7339]|uniref:phage tail protein n=1 Tax=Clostridium sp. UBA7339 TaxID=1946376 RepID=UPI003217043F